MSRRCDLTGKEAQFGHIVSHAENKTNRRFKVNIHHIKLRSDVLDRNFSLKIAAHTLRSIDHNGGLDKFLVTASDRNLSVEGIKLKRQIKKAMLLAQTGGEAPEAPKAKKPAKAKKEAA